MTNLLRAESYALLHSRYFWGLAAGSLTLGTLLLLDSASRTETLRDASLYNVPLLSFLAIVLAALFLGAGFTDRTLASLVGAGHSRGAVFLGKALVYQAACLVILAAPMVPATAWGFLAKGQAPAVGVLGGLAVLAAVLAADMLPLCCAFVFREQGHTLVIPLAVWLLTIFALNGENGAELAVLLPMGQLRLMARHALPTAPITVLAVDVLWIVGLSILSYRAFARSDLK